MPVPVVSAELFLETMWPEIHPAASLLIWTHPEKRSLWFQETAKAARAALSKAALGQQVYLGVCLMPAGLRHDERGPADRAMASAGLWLDLDIQGPGHKKTNLPTTQDEALALLDPAWPPSAVVHSGGGLQIWWFHKEPVYFATIAERQRYAVTVDRWQRSIRNRARVAGLDVDSTADLSRLLRVPGTMNTKTGQPVPVQVIEWSERRYELGDIEDYLDELGVPVNEKLVVMEESGEGWEGVTLHRDAVVSPADMDALALVDPKFPATWSHARTDMQDQSQSGYDMALADVAVRAGWQAQKVLNLLVANRNAHNRKILRLDYYRRTIGKVQRTQREAEREKKQKAAEPKKLPTDPTQRRGEAMRIVSEVIGVEVTRVVKFAGKVPQYRLETKAGVVLLGGIENAMSQTKFRERVTAQLNRFCPPMKVKKWTEVGDALFSLVEEEESDMDSSGAGQLEMWLATYLTAHYVYESWESLRTARADGPAPHADQGYVWVNATALRNWLVVSPYREKVDQHEVSQGMRLLGSKPRTKAMNGTSYSYWALPPERWPVEKHVNPARRSDAAD